MGASAKPRATYNIFLSWSGIRSKWIAETFREWLPLTLQACKPWMSAKDIEKGTRSLQEIAKALQGVRFGISFLTPENLTEPWILYEAGALTRNVDDKTRLYTVLLGGLQSPDVKPPLGILQHTRPTKADMLSLVQSINLAVSDDPLTEKQVETVFEQFWSRLQERLHSMPVAEEEVDAKRSPDDMIAEILEIVRSEKAITTNVVWPTTGVRFVPTESNFIPGGSGYTFGEPFWAQTENSLAPSPSKKTFFIKLKNNPTIQMVEGNYAIEDPAGTLVVFNSSGVTIRRFDKSVERWGEAK